MRIRRALTLALVLLPLAATASADGPTKPAKVTPAMLAEPMKPPLDTSALPADKLTAACAAMKPEDISSMRQYVASASSFRHLNDVPEDGYVIEEQPLAPRRVSTNEIRAEVAILRHCPTGIETVSDDGVPQTPKAIAAHFAVLKRIGEERKAADKLERTYAAAEAWAVAEDAQLEAEKTCRATAGCVAQRNAGFLEQSRGFICGRLKLRAGDIDAIARERSNPGGVVDLEELHRLGQEVQAIDAELPTVKARYAELAHKPFSASVCDKP